MFCLTNCGGVPNQIVVDRLVMPAPPAELTNCVTAPAVPAPAQLDPARPDWVAISVYVSQLHAAHGQCRYVLEQLTAWITRTRQVAERPPVNEKRNE